MWQGREACAPCAVLACARTLYEYQDFIYIGEYGENGFVEDYASKVRGEPTQTSLSSTGTQSDRRNILWRTTVRCHRSCLSLGCWATESG